MRIDTKRISIDVQEVGQHESVQSTCCVKFLCYSLNGQLALLSLVTHICSIMCHRRSLASRKRTWELVKRMKTVNAPFPSPYTHYSHPHHPHRPHPPHTTPIITTSTHRHSVLTPIPKPRRFQGCPPLVDQNSNEMR